MARMKIARRPGDAVLMAPAMMSLAQPDQVNVDARGPAVIRSQAGTHDP
jgi:hypothetical protein